MNDWTNTLSSRMSLRAPQRESLEILDRLSELLTLKKDVDLKSALEVIQTEYPQFADFERDFPCFCFALATGVGKTRLMGAFIAFLHFTKGIRNFFILAPNLTVYNKLVTDFTPGTQKYVFAGIDTFLSNPPTIITGDNYESMVGTLFDDPEQVEINIFNVSKITAKDKGHLAGDDQKASLPRFRRLSEYIGKSYFDYLAAKDDLVLLMDESHHYR
ncbi:MAG: DEAD/DEAH box helicase family protein, partial [Fibrobacter sp.]|nr:DEAD/DEAH box helicase family protein [Fibrobacter sp.]